jgi:hypothetical protein
MAYTCASVAVWELLGAAIAYLAFRWSRGRWQFPAGAQRFQDEHSRLVPGVPELTFSDSD